MGLFDDVQEQAVRAAKAAGSVLLKHYGKTLEVRDKPGAGIVTNADIEAEQAALQIINERGGFDVVAEESSPESNGKSDVPGRWFIDPLDGTTNFAHGFPMFCVSIGAEVKGELAVGVIYHPVLDDLYVAQKDQGSTLNGRKIEVSPTKDMSQALLSTGFACGADAWKKDELRPIEKLGDKARSIRRPGSAALDLAYTARGVFDGFWEKRLSPWDVAAGGLLVLEAGGSVTGYHGQKFDPEFGEIIASNGGIHDQLLTVMKESQL